MKAVTQHSELTQQFIPLRDAFLRWQCRVRQMSMRETFGRPDSAIKPTLTLDSNSEPIGNITINSWVQIPDTIELPDNQQDRDMIARELLIKFQMSDRHPLVTLRKAYMKF